MIRLVSILAALNTMKTVLILITLLLGLSVLIADSFSTGASTNTVPGDMNVTGVLTVKGVVVLTNSSGGNWSAVGTTNSTLSGVATANQFSAPGILLTNGSAQFVDPAGATPANITLAYGSGFFWSGSTSTNNTLSIQGGSFLAGASAGAVSNVSITLVNGGLASILADVNNLTVTAQDGGIMGVVADGKFANVTSSDGAGLFQDVLPNHTNSYANIYSGSIGAGRTQGSNERLVARNGSAVFGNDLDAENFSWVFGRAYTNSTGGFVVGYSGVPVLFANSTGVGMGTNAPSQKLEVLGSIKVSSSIYFGTNILSFSGTNLTWNGTTITVP